MTRRPSSFRDGLTLCLWLVLAGSASGVRAAAPDDAVLAKAATYLEMAANAYHHKPPAYAEAIRNYEVVLEMLKPYGDDARVANPRATALFGLGMSQYGTGLFDEAFASLSAFQKLGVTVDLNADDQRKKYITLVQRLDELRESGYVEVIAVPRDAVVLIDGKRWQPNDFGWMPLPPGGYELRVEAPGYVGEKKVIQLGLREAKVVPITLAEDHTPPPAPASSWHETAGIASAIAGGVGLVTGIVGLVVADGKQQQLDDASDANGDIDTSKLSQKAAYDLADARDTWNAVGVTGFVVAGAGAIAATVFFLLPDDAPRKTPAAAALEVVPLPSGGFVSWQTAF